MDKLLSNPLNNTKTCVIIIIIIIIIIIMNPTFYE